MISIEDLKKARQEAIDEMIEEMTEFGLAFETAEKMAPILLRYVVDPRGLIKALIDDEPRIALQLGICKRH